MNENYSSDYLVRLATLAALGGDTTKEYRSVYDVDLAILEKTSKVEIAQAPGRSTTAVMSQAAVTEQVEAIDETFDDYLKSADAATTYATKEELGGAGIQMVIVESLPTVGEAKKIYLVLNEESEEGNVYSEYMYINNQWELLGNTGVDLTGYAKIADVNSSLALKADKTEIPSLTGYATESWVEGKGYLTEHQSLADYAKIADVNSSLGLYATNASLQEVESVVSEDLFYIKQDYAKKTDIPNVSAYAKIADVDSSLAVINASLALKGNVSSTTIANLVTLTLTAYDALTTKDPSTFYIIVEANITEAENPAGGSSSSTGGLDSGGFEGATDATRL